MSCVLRVSGRDFAVDEFLSGSGLKPIAIFRRGEPRSPASNVDGPKFSASGFHLAASDVEFSNVQAQISDAVRFLEKNQNELTRIVAFSGVENLTLDFGIEQRDVAAQSERFPPDLLRMAGNLGIWLAITLYPPQNKTEERGHMAST